MTVIESISKRINNIPMLSAVASRLLTISGDNNVSLKQIVKIVETDAFLTARILKVANSAAFSVKNPISTLNQAIVYLGERIVLGIAIESSSSFFNLPLDGYQSAAGELWAHSLHTAIAAREISSMTLNHVSPDLAFTAGLLHDIGKPVISDLFSQSTPEMTQKCDHRLVEDFTAAERELLGTDHAEVGSELAIHWKLPEPLQLAIKFHHHPGQAGESYQNLIYVTHIADIVAMMAGTGTGADVLAYRMDDQYKKHIRIDKNGLACLLFLVQSEFEKSKKFVFAGAEGENA
jgi:putative nucleotidyltransferase with HDIG domain